MPETLGIERRPRTEASWENDWYGTLIACEDVTLGLFWIATAVLKDGPRLAQCLAGRFGVQNRGKCR